MTRGFVHPSQLKFLHRQRHPPKNQYRPGFGGLIVVRAQAIYDFRRYGRVITGNKISTLQPALHSAYDDRLTKQQRIPTDSSSANNRRPHFDP